MSSGVNERNTKNTNLFNICIPKPKVECYFYTLPTAYLLDMQGVRSELLC